VELPTTGGPLLARTEAVFSALATGEITPGEAAEVARLIEVERKVAADAAATAVPKPVEPDAMGETPAQTEARQRALHARDAALREEVAAALRVEVTTALRAELEP